MGFFFIPTAKENTTFWWIGDEDNWSNVYCAFEDRKSTLQN